MLPAKRELAFRMLQFKPAETGIAARLPEAYMKFHRELYETQPKPVHWIPEEGKWKRDPVTGVVKPVQNIPLLTKFPKELNNVLLGGEMVIQGFEKRRPTRRRVPKFWVPQLFRSAVYSEVLNKHIEAIVTQRLIMHIHEYKSFDNYLLQNLACDLRTNLALKIKRRILEALLYRNLPYDEVKNTEIYEKYKQFIIPREDLEWYGLTFKEACMKQTEIEAKATTPYPLKHKYRLELLEELRNPDPTVEPLSHETSQSWISKLKRPFTRT